MGNWQGNKLTQELRFHDGAYNRTYEPDAVREVEQTIKGGYYANHLKKEPYQAR